MLVLGVFALIRLAGGGCFCNRWRGRPELSVLVATPGVINERRLMGGGIGWSEASEIIEFARDSRLYELVVEIMDCLLLTSTD